MTLKVCIMTPDQIFWNKEAEEIILPTNTGQMGVLTNHAPLITALDIGVMSIRTKTEWLPVALMGGFALVKQPWAYTQFGLLNYPGLTPADTNSSAWFSPW